MSKGVASLLVVTLIALALFPSAALAETFTLPAKEVFLEGWDWYEGGLMGCGGPNPTYCAWQNYQNWYTPSSYIVYRVLITDNSETILDMAPQRDVVTNLYPQYRHTLTANVPEKEIDLEPGSYRIELRKIDVPKVTANHNPDYDIDSVVDWWAAQRAKPGPGVDCVVTWNENDCWIESLVEQDVLLSEKAVVLEYYEITVSAPLNSPERSEKSFVAHTLSPFVSSKGDEEPPSHSATAPMALAGILGLTALGAGAYLYRSYSTSTGSSFKAYQTQAGRANYSALLAERAHIKRLEEAYAKRYRDAMLKKARAAQLAAVTAAQKKTARQLELELATAERYHTYEQKAAAYDRIAKKYGIVEAATVATAYKEAHALASAPKTELPPMVMQTTKDLPPMVIDSPSTFADAESLDPNTWMMWREFDDMGKPLTKRELAQLKKDPSKYWDFIAARKNKTREEVELEATLYSGAAVGGAAAAAFVGPYLFSLQGASLTGMVTTSGSLQIPAFVTGTGALTVATTYAFEVASGSGGPVSDFLGGVYERAKSGVSWLEDNLGGLFKPDSERFKIPNEAIEEEAIREYNQNKGRGPMDPSLEIYPKIRGDECGIEVAISPSIIKFGKGEAEYDVYSPKLKIEGPEISFDFSMGEGENKSSYEIQFSGNIETQLYNPIGTELVMKMSKKGCVLSETNIE